MKTRIDPPLRGRAYEPGVRVVHERDREDSKELPDELWTLAVTQTLIDRLPRLRPPAGGAAPGARPGPAADPSSGSGLIAREEGSDTAPSGETDAGATSGNGRGAGAGTASGAGAGGAFRSKAGENLPSELRAEVSDERLGRLELHVARGAAGLDIVISVADSRVKALIEADQATLMKTLKDAGLRVASVQIGSTSRAGTTLAGDRTAAERPRTGGTFRQHGARWRTYQGSLEEEDAEREGVDFTA